MLLPGAAGWHPRIRAGGGAGATTSSASRSSTDDTVLDVLSNLAKAASPIETRQFGTDEEPQAWAWPE